MPSGCIVLQCIVVFVHILFAVTWDSNKVTKSCTPILLESCLYTNERNTYLCLRSVKPLTGANDLTVLMRHKATNSANQYISAFISTLCPVIQTLCDSVHCVSLLLLHCSECHSQFLAVCPSFERISSIPLAYIVLFYCQTFCQFRQFGCE
jgi:hypothetical protein